MIPNHNHIKVEGVVFVVLLLFTWKDNVSSEKTPSSQELTACQIPYDTDVKL